MTPPPLPLNPLEGFGTAAHAYGNLTSLIVGWLLFALVFSVAVVAGKIVATRRRERVACPLYGGRATVLRVRDAAGVLDVVECTRRPGELPLRCTKDCLLAAA
jgi:hypothetical protein